MAVDDRTERLRQAIRLRRASAEPRRSEMEPRPAGEVTPLGELQRGLWLAHQVDPGSPAYNLTSAFRVRDRLEVGMAGGLDVERLERAFNQVVARHRILRSTFVVEAGVVVQKSHPATPLAVERFAVEAGGVLALATRQAAKPFDLAAGGLVRLVHIEEEGGDESLLVLVLHHILADERSLALLWEELVAGYEGQGYEGRSSIRDPREPRDLELQYDDYLYWRARQGDERRGEELDYWRRQLDPLPSPLRMPFERPTSGQGSVAAEGRLLSCEVEATNADAVEDSIRRLAAETGATPFMVYAFLFRLLLQRYTEGTRLAFATPVSTRAHRATAQMVGYFSNPVVIYGAVDELLPVGAAIGEFSRVVREALAHGSVSFHQLAEALAPPRRLGRHPIYQTMFVYQERVAPPRFGSLRLEPVDLDLGASKFDLTLFVSAGEGALKISVEYRVDRFDEVWMRNLLGHYAALLGNLAPRLDGQLDGLVDGPLAELSMLSAGEQAEVMAYGRGAELEADAMELLPARILGQTRRSPAAPAVVCGDRQLSYGELAGSASAVAQELVARGVAPGERVGLFVGRSTQMIAGLLGCHWAAAGYVPLDPTYPEARQRDVLQDAEVAAVLTTSELRHRLPEGPWAVIEVDRLPEGDSCGVDLASLTPDSPAYILYTSGSTGRPKGVVIDHENLRLSNAARVQYYETPPKRFLLIPSLAFDSSVAGLYWTLAVGGTLVIPTDEEAKDPRQLARLVASERVSCLLCVPSLYAGMLHAEGDLLRSLEAAIVAGEPCSSGLVAEHFQALPKARLFNEYGPTEATVWATVHEMTLEDGERPVAIGRPIPGVRMEVLDSLGRPVPAGIPGEGWIVGPTVARGYWRRPELTADRFGSTVAGRYRTGDRLAWATDGRLLFLGRVDEQIKLRGFRIEPGEVEAALLASPRIERAAVVARSSGRSSGTAATAGEVHLVAFVVATGEVESWRQDLVPRLPAHMIPSRLVVLAELPSLPNGKVDRRELREMVLEGGPSDVEVGSGGGGQETALLGTREQALISLWQGLLGRGGFTVNDNFFTLGGHSLLAVEMSQAIERDFEVTLGANTVFDNPTVAQLAQCIAAQRIARRGGSSAVDYQHLFPIQPRGSKSPFIVAVPHFFSALFASRFRGERPVYGLRGVSLRPGGNRGRWPTMEVLGEELVEEIRRRFPEGGCIVAGYSFGASMAVEVVRVMERLGVPVHRLYLIAPMAVDSYRFGPLRLQIDGLRQPVEELSPWAALRLLARANHPFTRGPYARLRRWLTVRPLRRILCGVGALRRRLGLPLTSRILHADVRVERFRLHSRYRPGVVRTPTVIFNAQETATDAAATWRPYFAGGCTVVPTPDPHLGDESAEAARAVILRHLRDLGEE